MTSLPPADDIRSKAFTLLGALAFVEDRWGTEGRERVIAASDAAARTILNARLLPSQWVPFAAQVRLYETIDRVYGAGDLELCREIGKFTSEYEMSRFHKAFLKVAGLDLWVRTAGLMWRRYYSAGKLEVIDIGEGQGRVRISRFNPLSPAFCYDFAGWLHRTVEIAGYRDVEVAHDRCVLDGAGGCDYTGTWR